MHQEKVAAFLDTLISSAPYKGRSQGSLHLDENFRRCPIQKGAIREEPADERGESLGCNTTNHVTVGQS